MRAALPNPWQSSFGDSATTCATREGSMEKAHDGSGDRSRWDVRGKPERGAGATGLSRGIAAQHGSSNLMNTLSLGTYTHTLDGISVSLLNR